MFALALVLYLVDLRSQTKVLLFCFASLFLDLGLPPRTMPVPSAVGLVASRPFSCGWQSGTLKKASKGHARTSRPGATLRCPLLLVANWLLVVWPGATSSFLLLKGNFEAPGEELPSTTVYQIFCRSISVLLVARCGNQ